MLSTIYALLCIIVPCSLYQLIICKRQNKKQENKAIHFVWVYIFLLYIYLTFSVAGIGSIWDIGHYDTIIRLEEINLLPFQSEGIMTYVLNIIMFLPLGFLIPLIWKRYRNPLKIFMIGFGFSLSIELCQLFNRRNTDIDDLMMNTLGAVIGYFIWKLTKRLFKNIYLIIYLILVFSLHLVHNKFRTSNRFFERIIYGNHSKRTCQKIKSFCRRCLHGAQSQTRSQYGNTAARPGCCRKIWIWFFPDRGKAYHFRGDLFCYL